MAKEDLVALLKSQRLNALSLNDGNGPERAISAYDALRNPKFVWAEMALFKAIIRDFGIDTIGRLVSEIRYEGYIARQGRRVERFERFEDFVIPPEFNYAGLRGLKKEASQKLSQFRPETLGQASRISGVTPGDITILMVHLHRA
jgi:tRNA uridine 5-carboxymethylaminomethyl modification enzyme